MLGTLTLNFAPGIKLCPLVKQVLGNFHERSSVYYSLSVDFLLLYITERDFPAGIYLFKSIPTRTMCELYEKLTIKIPD